MRERPLPRSVWASAGIGGLAVLAAFTVLSLKIGEDFAIPALLVGGVVAVFALKGQVGRALARRIEGGAADTAPEVLAEVDELRARMLELEERLDFAERLLASTRREEPQRVEPGA